MHGENRTIPPIDEKKTAELICNFLKDNLNQSKTEGAVIGLSGGLDSSTTAYLCARAFGKDKILGIIMPSETTSREDVQDAVKVAESLGIEYETVEVDGLIEPFKDLCSHSDEGYNTVLAGANLKARIRMMILYYHANAMKRLVVGTGNRTELLVGYFTKYGDGGVDILPIGDLYKNHVRALASYLQVPVEIIEKAPTAGLWAGQTDEDELGMKYETLDRLLYLMVDKKLGDQEVAYELKIPLEEVLRIKRMVRSAEHKLKPAPIAAVR
ncbi:NAD+ synthase [Methanobacterium aggregans]|uniref:NAD+ synthase n=1 Tax=Methanobacterium aggregans TaxID=1615586 RepID=UPI001AE16213|nr:NAD+ synthase [Methanobacterium aggregans]MBP2046084.1 NAD+ synthase [Methanobacterium aggregans]